MTDVVEDGRDHTGRKACWGMISALRRWELSFAVEQGSYPQAIAVTAGRALYGALCTEDGQFAWRFQPKSGRFLVPWLRGTVTVEKAPGGELDPWGFRAVVGLAHALSGAETIAGGAD